MGVTSKLLALYRVDQQLRGVKSRLAQAERHLKRQEHLLKELDERKSSYESQLRQLEASSQNCEVEIKAFDERIEMLRDRMNNAQTSKEHAALLTEINTIKADRGHVEDRELEMMKSIEELRVQTQTVKTEHDERIKVRDHALEERDARAKEIQDRMSELEAERAEKLEDVPADALAMYQDRVDMGLEDVMAPVREEDRRNMVYISEASNQELPIELVNKLLLRQGIVIDPFSDAILYIPEDVRESIESDVEKKRKKRASASA